MLEAVGPAQISARLSALDRRFDQSRGQTASAQPPVVEAEVIEDFKSSARGRAATGDDAVVQLSREQVIASQALPLAPTTYGPDAVPRYTRNTPSGKLVSVYI